MKKPLTFALLFAFVMPFIAMPVQAVDDSEKASTSSGLSVTSKEFPDVPRTHSYYVGIKHLTNIGVINGYKDGTFGPEKTIMRGEVLKVILKGSSIEAPDDFGDSEFSDVPKDAWFAPYVMQAKKIGIVKGNGKDGTFSPGRKVNKAEFLKMLLESNKIKKETIEAVSNSNAVDVPKDAWFAPYVNYAVNVGLVELDDQKKVYPNKELTRAEVAHMMFLLSLIKGKPNTQHLLNAAEMEMMQIEVYIAADKIKEAKYASELAVDLTAQAVVNTPDSAVTKGASNLAEAYDLLVEAFIAGVNKKNKDAIQHANDAMNKASNAWVVNNDTEAIAKHIKDVAKDIIAQAEEK